MIGETTIDTPVTEQVNAYSTTLTAQIQGGPVLYDQSFTVPFVDPAFQTAIGTAESALTDAGAVSILGPTLTSSATTTSSTTNTVQTNETATVTSVISTTYIGALGGTTIDTGEVIPGCPEGAGPEPINTGLSNRLQVRVHRFRVRGLAPAPRNDEFWQFLHTLLRGKDGSM